MKRDHSRKERMCRGTIFVSCSQPVRLIPKEEKNDHQCSRAMKHDISRQITLFTLIFSNFSTEIQQVPPGRSPSSFRVDWYRFLDAASNIAVIPPKRTKFRSLQSSSRK
mmetsp:Transcript_3503/g.13392  ORF Transcript_3503/g.13392 Transcript_3503/m.13392 type:complete len:109 (+) Transcript_3503:1511-1837(+)